MMKATGGDSLVDIDVLPMKAHVAVLFVLNNNLHCHLHLIKVQLKTQT